jgi:hypothetical protein
MSDADVFDSVARPPINGRKVTSFRPSAAGARCGRPIRSSAFVSSATICRRPNTGRARRCAGRPANRYFKLRYGGRYALWTQIGTALPSGARTTSAIWNLRFKPYRKFSVEQVPSIFAGLCSSVNCLCAFNTGLSGIGSGISWRFFQLFWPGHLSCSAKKSPTRVSPTYPQESKFRGNAKGLTCHAREARSWGRNCGRRGLLHRRVRQEKTPPRPSPKTGREQRFTALRRPGC